MHIAVLSQGLLSRIVARKIFFALCSLHLCVPLFFDVILLPIAMSVFPNLVTVATFYGELAGGF